MVINMVMVFYLIKLIRYKEKEIGFQIKYLLVKEYQYLKEIVLNQMPDFNIDTNYFYMILFINDKEIILFYDINFKSHIKKRNGLCFLSSTF